MEKKDLWIEILEKGKKWLFPLLALIIFLGVFGFRACHSSRSNSVSDFLNAFSKEGSLFQPNRQEEAFSTLVRMVEKTPSLQGEYDALLVEAGLLFNHPTEPMAKRTLSRVGKNASSETALLIHEEKWNEAYSQVLDASQKEGENIDKAINLFRKAYLEEKLGKKTESEKSYGALAALLKKRSPDLLLFKESLEGPGEDLLTFLEKKSRSH